jgi:hypothetical protein
VPAAAGWLWVALAAAHPASALYYETLSPAGTLVIDRLSLTEPSTTTEITAVGKVDVFGIAVDRRSLYWTFQAGVTGRGAIMRVSLDGRHVRRLVGGLRSPQSLIAVDGYVYWSDQNAIGRVRFDGSRVRRQFIDLPRERGGGVADGLASDGRHVFFSRCLDHTIGRANLDGTHVDARFLSLGRASCPQGIAVAAGHLYWTQLGSGTIGRATLGGRDAKPRWLNVHTDQGPFQVVADARNVYWNWGGVAGTPSFTGRANADGSQLDPRFLPDSLYPMALTGPGVGGGAR